MGKEKRLMDCPKCGRMNVEGIEIYSTPKKALRVIGGTVVGFFIAGPWAAAGLGALAHGTNMFMNKRYEFECPHCHCKWEHQF